MKQTIKSEPSSEVKIRILEHFKKYAIPKRVLAKQKEKR